MSLASQVGLLATRIAQEIKARSIDTVYVPALACTGASIVLGAGRYPALSQDSASASQLSTEFMLPAHWATFKIEALLSQGGGSGNWIFTATRAFVSSGGDMSAGDNNASLTVAAPNANTLLYTQTHTALACSPGQLQHFRLYRDAANSSDTGPNSLFHGLRLTKLT